MEKIRGKLLVLFVVAGIALLFGCVQDSGNYGAGNNGGAYGSNGNAAPSGNGMMNNGNGAYWANGTRGMMNGSYRGRGNGTGYGNGSRGMMGNLTQEQRQQIIAQIAQAVTDACNGKAEGDACELGAFGRNISGTCKISNGNLGCSFGMMGNRQ
ncbi:Uncharacterised protein [Candidatus Anstonella stagnisolia]|nr:Uncharacterised protein [Candidatus Anstonella stagnisolia]